MLNFPVAGGTSGHFLGAVFSSVLLGPWAALIAISIALVIQAFLFGDGGVTAIGANCFNIAFVMPSGGYLVYRLLSRGAPAISRRRWVAAAVAGYAGLNAAAVTTAVMFGLQPLLAKGPDGRPLYFPYPLEVALPVMAVQHLLFFGIIEAVLTAFDRRKVLFGLDLPAAQENSIAQTRAFTSLYLATTALAAICADRNDLLDELSRLPRYAAACYLITARSRANGGATPHSTAFTSWVLIRATGWRVSSR
jgi:ABC-type Co2+ transport system permease subunit